MTAEPSRPPFRLGLNYWPPTSVMRLWTRFHAREVAKDFGAIAGAGFDSVRIFLTWEHFQPDLHSVDAKMLSKLVTTLDLAHAVGLAVMPTLFTGHMSGVNWIPTWALGAGDRDRRFRVVSDGRVIDSGLRNWYADGSVARAQARLARELGQCLAGHPALWAWDLGNENSNCVRPPTRAHGRDWLTRITDALRAGDAGAQITLGLHMEDLEEDRQLGPAEAASVCDFLTMHGYPGYARWSRGPTDEEVLPFLATLTSWLGGGAPVVFSELGVPTYRAGDLDGESARRLSTTALVEEDEAAAYVARSLTALRASGCHGAMLWCHADYVPSAWHSPPLDLAVHERHFGQWRSDGTAKPALAAVRAFGASTVVDPADVPDTSWIDIPADGLYAESSLARLYRRYLDHAPPLTAR